MKSITAAEASKKFGQALKLADESPIEITRYASPRRRGERYVLMSAKVYEVLMHVLAAHRDQRVLVTMENAIAKLLVKEDLKGFRLLRIGNSMMKRFLDATGEKL